MAGPVDLSVVPGIDMTGFSKLQVVRDKVQVRVGAMKKAVPITTQRVGVGPSAMDFVHLQSHETWLSLAVTGNSKVSPKHALGRTGLLQVLHQAVGDICSGTLDLGADDNDNENDGEDFDPMNAVDVADGDPEAQADNGQASETGGGKAKRARLGKNPAKNKVVSYELPSHPPELGVEENVERRIKLYIKDRKQIWLHINDLEWAVRYLYIQDFLKGVPRVSPDSTGPGA
jgi:hypothetical protein